MKFFNRLMILSCLVLFNKVIAQKVIYGKVDSLGQKQGEWKIKLPNYPSLQISDSMNVICNFVNGKLNGNYYAFTDDSSKFIVFRQYENNKLKGISYVAINNKILETTLHYNDSLGYKTRFPAKKGKVIVNANVIYKNHEKELDTPEINFENEYFYQGEYLYFYKGKLTMKIIYERGNIKSLWMLPKRKWKKVF